MSYGSSNEQAPGGEASWGAGGIDAGAAQRRPLVAVAGDDPRLRQGAYLSDGVELYEVVGIRRSAVLIRGAILNVTIENCRNLSTLQLLPESVRRGFRLVRSAPVGVCPDYFEEIAW